MRKQKDYGYIIKTESGLRDLFNPVDRKNFNDRELIPEAVRKNQGAFNPFTDQDKQGVKNNE